ncbi:acyl carrier protein ACP [Toxoplasma gondii FOU]|uniref:Acyl carrier protein n=2 Tax=Toxoplasma gondii TaxID=5811 RepID=A0A086L6M5_TOXGO|nr:acyl carrier protein ACP [Toxoplasma gondii FOU]PUA89984.1 acyl carrier protein ACP [Toxoplasma gondii TgCATBr9]
MEMHPRNAGRKTLLALALFMATSIASSYGFVSPGLIRFNYRYGTCPNMSSGVCATPSTASLGTLGQPAGTVARRPGPFRSVSATVIGSPSSALFAADEASSDDRPLLERVKDVVADQLGVDRARINPESNFIKDLDADSLDSVELVMAFEEKFGVSIPDEEASKIATVQDALSYIEKAKSATA